MKKILFCVFSVFLFLPKVFSDCYFSFDGLPMTMTNENMYGYYIAGSFGLATSIKFDNFKENKTGYPGSLFTEIQFIGRKIPDSKKNSRSNSDNTEYRYDNDIYCSAGFTFLELIRPKISYGVLSKDFFASCVFGIPIPFERKFKNNETSVCGFQVHAGLEPVWNISEGNSFSSPSYLNFRANFKIYLDFSRRSRYAKYANNQRKIQLQKEESERKLRERQAEEERLEKQRQREFDEKTAKELGFSSVEDYYADLKKKEENKKAELNKLTRDEWEWALRAIMAYKTLNQYGYYPTYDEYTMKYINRSGLITMYQAECLGNLYTQKLVNRADEIVLFIKLCMMNNNGYCSAIEMSKIVKTLAEN